MEENQPEIDYKAQYEKLQNEHKHVLSGYDQLKSERQAEAERRKFAEEAKQTQDGDYKALLKSAKEEKENLAKQFHEFRSKIEQKETRLAAIKIANDLNPLNADAAEMLADYVEKRLKYHEDGFRFLDAQGQPSVMDSEQFKNEFKMSNKFKPLLMGSKASGGGALGASNRQSSHNGNTVDRATFDSWPIHKQSQFMRAKGSIHD